MRTSSRTMDGLWTPNFEQDADRHAAILAKRSGTAVALYFWLHSRVYACNNNVGISAERLSTILKVDLSTMRRAIKSLEASGLISYESRSGNGGGCVFHLHDLSFLNAGNNATLNQADSQGLKPPNVAETPSLPWQIRNVT